MLNITPIKNIFSYSDTTLYNVLNGGCCDDSSKIDILYFVTVRSMTVCEIVTYVYNVTYEKQYIQ